MGQVWKVIWVGKKRNTQNFVRKTKERDHLEDLGIDRRVILTWILHGMGWCGLNSSGSG
jgi:hypothetical protein